MLTSHRIVAVLIGAWLMFSGLTSSPVLAQSFRAPRAYNTGGRSRSNANPATRPVDTKALDAAGLEVTQAQSALDKAKTDLARVRETLRRAADESPELAAALAEQAKAQKAFDVANANLEGQLSLDSTYYEASKQKEALQGRVNDLRVGGTATPEQMTDAATAVLNAGQILSRLKSQAQATDPDFIHTKAALAQATAKVEALRQQYQQSLLSDPQWTAAQKAVSDADTRLQTAKTNLAKAQQAVAAARARQQGNTVGK